MFSKDTFEAAALKAVIARCRIIELKEGWTAGHVDKVGEYSYIIAVSLGLDEKEAGLIEFASKAHDIGKSMIPEAVLYKCGEFTEWEKEIMKKHTTLGAEYLRGCGKSPLFVTAAEIALYHHECWNGKGYPFGLAGEKIPLHARIVAAADTFDILMRRRLYKEPWSLDEAVEYMKSKRGILFDPEIVDVIVKRFSPK